MAEPGTNTLKAEADFGVKLVGGTGDDRLAATSEGVASVDGGVGNDTITGAGLETFDVNAGDGNDTIRYAASPFDEIDPESVFELWGGAGTDKLYAGAAQDRLHFTLAGKARDIVFRFDGGSDQLVLEGDAIRTKSGD